MDISRSFVNLKKWIAFWIWCNLAGGKAPFYKARQLNRLQTYTVPELGRFGFRRWLWLRAVDYLKSQGDLTYTPTLREKF